MKRIIVPRLFYKFKMFIYIRMFYYYLKGRYYHNNLWMYKMQRKLFLDWLFVTFGKLEYSYQMYNYGNYYKTEMRYIKIFCKEYEREGKQIKVDGLEFAVELMCAELNI